MGILHKQKQEKIGHYLQTFPFGEKNIRNQRSESDKMEWELWCQFILAGKGSVLMFNRGDYIIYGTSGVCQVEDITTMNMQGIPRDRLYYVLNPSSQRGGKIYIPVDNQKTLMRRILTQEEAARLIDTIPEIEELWITNEKMREEKYKECMRSGDCREWIKIIKTLYMRKMQRSAQGKKITSTDEKYLKMAEDYLYSELEIPLEIPKSQMEQYITVRMEQLMARQA